MRVGRNILKVHNPLKPARITIAIVTFVPEEVGYFQDRLNVIKLSLRSLYMHTDLPVDVLVFDNGSCSELVDYLVGLKNLKLINYLILSSTNIGLAGAYNIISSAAPGEFVAFANDDVFYYPKWLSPQIAILDNFPDVGLVSGSYVRGTHPRTAQLAIDKGLEVREVEAPNEWIEEFCRDASYESSASYYQSQEWLNFTDLSDKMISSDGFDAYAGGVCWQAVFRKRTMQELLPIGDPENNGFPTYDSFFHMEIIRKGYLRLSTTNRYVRHIGNFISSEMSSIGKEYAIDVERTAVESSVGFVAKLMRSKYGKSIIWKTYNTLYRMVYQ